MKRIKLLYDTVKYLTSRQIYYRVFYMVRNKLIARKPILISKTISVIKVNYLYKSQYINKQNTSNADNILDNYIETVSGIKVHIDKNIDWDIEKNKYRLVCFRLNSFKYLLCLADAYEVNKQKKYIEKGFSLINDWIEKNFREIKGDKWNPYVIAERLMYWIGFVSAYCNDDSQLQRYAQHIYSQALELKDSLEYQLGANHLLSEARALMYAGVFLSDKSLYKLGKKTLLEEINEQFLPDGGHYERSVSYHVEALQQCFEASMLMKEIKDKDYNLLVKLMYKPFVFLHSMIMADGNIPLVNDAATDYPFLAKDFLYVSNMFGWHSDKALKGDYSSRWNLGFQKNLEKLENKSIFPNTGFYICNLEKDGHKISVFFDVGDNGPDYNLGHTHADALNVLLTADNKPILVDSGVFTYMPGEQRNYCRSTAAHNTVEIDRKNNTEIWSAFRVAKRGHAKILNYHEDDNEVIILASYDGYSNIFNKQMLHKRKVYINKNSLEINIIDFFDTESDDFTGVVNYHFAPETDIIKENEKIILIDKKHIMTMSQTTQLKDCEVAEQFGVMKKAKVASCKIKINNKFNFKTKIQLFDLGGM